MSDWFRALRSNGSFDTDAKRRSLRSSLSFVAGQSRRLASPEFYVAVASV